MSDQAPERSSLLARRLACVGAVSALNAEALKLTQILAGMEMDALRIELRMRVSAGDGQLVRDLHEVQRKAETAQAAKADCEERIAVAEREIDEIDGLLAGISRGLGRE